jgi:hypothetical protein
MQTQFCWIPGKKYCNFCYSCLSCFLIFVCMKNSNVKNLDLRYLKIYPLWLIFGYVVCYVIEGPIRATREGGVNGSR